LDVEELTGQDVAGEDAVGGGRAQGAAVRGGEGDRLAQDDLIRGADGRRVEDLPLRGLGGAGVGDDATVDDDLHLDAGSGAPVDGVGGDEVLARTEILGRDGEIRPCGIPV
jgi:hypothetical protein